MKRLVCLLVWMCVAMGVAGSADAANRTVCASGCQYTSLQTAINDAVPGDTILLRAGATFTGHFVLRKKNTTSTAFITIRSDAPATSLPADGVRLVPEGKPGANVTRAVLARLVGQGGNWRSTPVVRVEPGAHHYRLQFLDIDGAANEGYGTLVAIGENSSLQTTLAAAPHTIVLDRVYIHGHARKGMRRGIALNSRETDIRNSYISGFMNVADAQAIGVFNGAGPFRIVNNFIEGAGENILFGGSDPKTPNLIPSDIEIRGNHFYKNPAWREPVLKAPGKPTVAARTGGALAAGTHYFKVAAIITSDGADVVSAASTESSVTVAASGAVSLSWSGVSGADKYRVYRGTATGTQAVYTDTTATTLIYTGSSEKLGKPRSTGMRWTAKNHLELKSAQRVVVNGNLFEHNWAGFQNGYAILFTPKNQEGSAPWTTVRDVTFINNRVRHVAGGINISGEDWSSVTEQARNFRIANNVFEDISAAYGNKGPWLLIAAGPANIVIDHNTVLHEGPVLEVEGPPVPGFVFTNNLSKHNAYGVKGKGRAVGTDSLNFYFPGWVFKGNALAGGPASAYPAGNQFPSVTQFMASFVNAAAGDYTLLASSPLNNSGTDGKDIGATSLVALTTETKVVIAPEEVAPPAEDGVVDSPAVLPAGWTAEDIGLATTPGATEAGAGTFALSSAGEDIWDTGDRFHFAYRALTGDGTIVARVATLAGADPWAKAGVMVRATTAAGSVHASMLVSVGKGLAFQRRRATNALSVHTAAGPGTAPRWVKLTRAGNTLTAATSTDGRTWTVEGTDTIAMPADVLVGLALSSHDRADTARATFDNIQVTTGTAALPVGWESHDVGRVGVAGSATANAGTFTVKGAGADIWGSADAFHFAAQPLAGDGEIVARVAAVSGSEAWTKVGVMMRLTLDAGSPHAFMAVTAAKGLAFQRRTVTGGISTTTAAAGTAPEWVKLSRRGDVITASASNDGTTWKVVGSQTVGMPGTIYVGLAVTSHDATRAATGTFDGVRVTW